MIQLTNISKTYRMGSSDVHALDRVSLTIHPGEFVAIMGPSGSGKSTLMHILGFLDRPDSGGYSFSGIDVHQLNDDELAALRSRRAGFVFQQFHLLPRLTARENAALPLVYAGQRDMHHRAQECLEAVGLKARMHHSPNELSGGERQRVAIARALVNDPLVIFADEPTGNLDTRSEAEIISILKELNTCGRTIIMVTHEKEVAEQARRIIQMRDGKILSDSGSSLPSSVNTSVTSLTGSPGLRLNRAELADHFRQSVHAILSNRLRSLLSMLGILIGVAAVIAMLALGQGAKESINQRLSSLGSNLLMIYPGSPQSRGVMLESGSVTRFTLEDARALADLPAILKISPIVRGRAQLVFADRNWNSQVTGTGHYWAAMKSSIPKTGRFFTESELRMRERVAVVGYTVVRELFNAKNPVGRTIRINRIPFSIIGVLPEKGSSGWQDDDDIVVIPVTTAMYRLLGKKYVDSIDAEVRSPDLMETAEQSVRALLIKRLRLPENKQDSFQVRNMAEIRQTIESTTRTMSMLLGCIAAISLFVGGIGIMNIMLVSVTERTREIGLRKAIGARKSDIITQFLIEACLMTLIGGAMGILLGGGAALLISLIAGWTTSVSAESVLTAFGFSVFIGIIFGLKPAMQAARLNPIEALRYE